MFTLPSLPYEYGALQPYITESTMKIHHTKHHQGYVNKLNRALESFPVAPSDLRELLLTIDDYDSAVRNNAGGHYNHTLFWESLSPEGTKEPTGVLAEAIVAHFGGFNDFVAQFSAEAAKLFGSGWTWLCMDSRGKLALRSTANQDNPLMEKGDKRMTPILGIDLWEHAYYLSYQNRRVDYIAAFWQVVDWGAIAGRYRKNLDQ